VDRQTSATPIAAKIFSRSSEIRGRITGQVELALAAHVAGILPEPVALVRLGPLSQILSLVRRRIASLDIHAQFFGQHIHHTAEGIGIAIVPERRHEDLQRALVVGHPDVPIAHDVEHCLVIVPRDVMEDEPG
jgi:hypothetical protein